MFAKSKCLLVLSRPSRYVQCRSIRKNSQLKYSAASLEGLSSKVKVKGLGEEDVSQECCDHEVHSNRAPVGDFAGSQLVQRQFPDQKLLTKKTKLDEVIRKAEALVSCRFQRSESSPIGVGLSIPDAQRQPAFTLLPNWFETESSSMTSRIPQLLGSGHPILKLKQCIKPDSEDDLGMLLNHNIQWRAFVILLVAKSFGYSMKVPQDDRQQMATIDEKQRTLAEIAEMMHTGFLLHRTLAETKYLQPPVKNAALEEESSFHVGNKIVTLLGDILLARSSKGFSALKNNRVTELMSDAIGDFSESEILRLRQLEFFKNIQSSSLHTEQVKCIPTFELWRNRVNLDVASLIGRTSLCTTIFGQHEDTGVGELAFKVGQQIGLVLQAFADLELFTSGNGLGQPTFDLGTLPVVFHLGSGDFTLRMSKYSNPREIYQEVMTSPSTLLRTQQALEQLKEDALRLISRLPQSTPAPEILEDFIDALS